MHRMGLTVVDRGGAIELAFSRQPEARDQVSAWYLSGMLIDAGGAHTAGELVDWLAGRSLGALFLGHHHEDHSAGAFAVVERRAIPVYGSRGTAARLRRPAVVPGYRARLWGQRRSLRVRPPAGAPLVAVPLPGHAPDQLGYLDPRTGWLFSGDLVLRRRQRVAMPGEDPWAMMSSLRRVLELAPSALATSHRGLIEDPSPGLRDQLAYLEELAASVARLRAAGLGVKAMVDELLGGEAVAPGGAATWRELSGGEFSSARWIRSFLRKDVR